MKIDTNAKPQEKQPKALAAMLEKVLELQLQVEDIGKNNTWDGNVYSYKYHQ